MIARRHHYVPKCYLESFSTKPEGSKKKNSELHVVDCKSRKVYLSAASNVALERDFNTINLDGHAPDAFENVLASMESEIGPALTRIVEAQSLAKEEDEKLLLNLICLLYIRNPRLRETIRAMSERAAKMVWEAALSSAKKVWSSFVEQAKKAGFVSQDAETYQEKLKATHQPDAYKLKMMGEHHILTELDLFNHTLPSFLERQWIIVKAPPSSEGFVTCDHPVCLRWSKDDPNRGGQRPGLKLKDTLIVFPISPKLAVLGAFDLGEGECQADEEEVAWLNGIIISNAQRQVYAQNIEFIYQMDQSKPPKSAAELAQDNDFKAAA